MSTNLSAIKKKQEAELSQQFSFWLNQERGSQVRGIGFFLNQRSKNIDRLIVETSKEYKLDQIPELGIFTVGGYRRAELHPILILISFCFQISPYLDQTRKE